MYINCPNCSTKFIILQHQLKENHKRLKCSKCQYTWSIEECTSEEKLNMKKRLNLSDGTNIAAHEGAIPNNFSPALAVNYLLTCAIITLALLMIGIIVTEKLELNLINRTPKTLKLMSTELMSSNQSHLLVKYRLYNSGNEVIKMPLIRVRLLDNNGRSLTTHFIKEDINIKPKQYANIKTEFSDIPKKAYEADILMGTKYELMLR